MYIYIYTHTFIYIYIYILKLLPTQCKLEPNDGCVQLIILHPLVHTCWRACTFDTYTLKISLHPPPRLHPPGWQSLREHKRYHSLYKGYHTSQAQVAVTWWASHLLLHRVDFCLPLGIKSCRSIPFLYCFWFVGVPIMPASLIGRWLSNFCNVLHWAPLLTLRRRPLLLGEDTPCRPLRHHVALCLVGTQSATAYPML